MTLGEKIKFYRNYRGFTQKQLGELTGIHEVAIRKYELDKNTPKEEQLDRISIALNVPMNVFLNIEVHTDRDMLPLLFAIDDCLSINIKSDDGKTFVLEFPHESINMFLKEWQAMKEMNAAGVQSKEDYEFWKKARPAQIRPIIGDLSF